MLPAALAEIFTALVRAYEQQDYAKAITLATQFLTSSHVSPGNPHTSPSSTQNPKAPQNLALNPTQSPQNGEQTNVKLLAQVWFICAMSLYYLGDMTKAIEYLTNARTLAPSDETIAINLSELLRKGGQLKNAALTLLPFLPSANPDIYFNLARILSQADDTPNAIALYQEVLKLSPNDTQAAYNLANLYAKAGSYTQAIALYKTCPSLEAQFNLAHTYTLIDDMDCALALYKSLDPYFAPRLRELGESEELYHAYNNSRAEFYFNYANALRYAGKSREAERMYQKAHMISPKLEYVINYAHLLLSVGVFERGFSYYQERLKLPKQEMDNTRFFVSKRHIAGLLEPAAIRECIKNARVLIFHEQGFGDTIMFARFVDMLVCKEKYLYVQPPIRQLFAKRFCVVNEWFNNFDYCISLPSLPYVLGISLIDDFAHNATYLARIFEHASLSKLESGAESSMDSNKDTHEMDFGVLLDSAQETIRQTSLQHMLDFASMPASQVSRDKPLQIGVFFHSNPNFAYAKHKSIPLGQLLESFESCAKKGLRFCLHSLQPEPLESIIAPDTRVKAIKTPNLDSALHAMSHQDSCSPSPQWLENQALEFHTYALHDFYDTAKLIRSMDIVVSVDSVVAHLAIALGIPCAALVYKRYDWRWGELGKTRFNGFCGGEVFAQNVYGQWDNVLQELESYLLHFQRD